MYVNKDGNLSSVRVKIMNESYIIMVKDSVVDKMILVNRGG